MAGERLFLALWPDAGVRAELAALSRGLKLDGGRRVAPPNLHATLIFLGDRDSAGRACIEQAAAAVRAAAFDLALTDVEWRRRTGIVWLAAQAPPPLLDLVAALESALRVCEYSPARRPYHAHVTLARDVARGPRRQAVSPIRWRAEAFCLVRSRLTPQGSEYAVLRSWPLA